MGTKTIVNLDTGEGLGFKCKETGVILRDSMSYLDHINGKKQQRALGMSMRVERSTVDQVKARFESHKRKKAEADAMGHVDFSKRVAMAEEDEEELRRQRAERKKAKKEAKKEQAAKPPEEELGGMDPEISRHDGLRGFRRRQEKLKNASSRRRVQ